MATATKTRSRRETKNTYGLPQGEGLRREIRDWFREQRKAAIKWLKSGGKLERKSGELAVWEREEIVNLLPSRIRGSIPYSPIEVKVEVKELTDDLPVETKFNPYHDEQGRFAGSGGGGSGWSKGSVNRRAGRQRHWDSRNDPIPAKHAKAAEKLDAIYQKHPVHATPHLRDPKNGETITVSVIKNAYHFVQRDEPKYRVRTVGSQSGLNDSQGFNNLNRAIKTADSWHRTLRKEGLKLKQFIDLEIKDFGDQLPDVFPDWDFFGLGSLAMSERMVPRLESIWDKAGQQFTSQIGLDPDQWEVSNPKTQEAIQKAALAFCDETNATTSLDLDEALAKTREALAKNLLEPGGGVPQLIKQIGQIFDGAEKFRARRIAVSEASRAVHQAQELQAKESQVVSGWEPLISEDACPLCQTIGRRCPAVKLGQPFAIIGDHPDYSTIYHPPFHPHCQCDMVPILITDKQPEWAKTLHDPEPEEEDYAEGEAPERLTNP